MNAITIPKNLIKNDDLVILPRQDYETLLRAAKTQKTHSQLDRDLDEALAEVKAGKITGPFKTAKALMTSLKSKR